MKARYRIRSLGWDTRELTEGVTFADGSAVEPYGLWDTVEGCWVNQWGKPDDEYWAVCRTVAVARRRDLNEWHEERPGQMPHDVGTLRGGH